jgi:hypothetical protein
MRNEKLNDSDRWLLVRHIPGLTRNPEGFRAPALDSGLRRNDKLTFIANQEYLWLLLAVGFFGFWLAKYARRQPSTRLRPPCFAR